MPMLIANLHPGDQAFTQLSHNVLAVLSRRHDGWCVYVGAVPGNNHDIEWRGVAAHGEKQREPVARAIVANLFHPGFDPGDMPYAV